MDEIGDAVRSIFVLNKMTVPDQTVERTSADIARLLADLGEFWETDLEEIVPAMAYQSTDE